MPAAFPADKRIVDKDTGADKGPFWGEKKRYPTVLEFNPHDESHTSFLLSTTCLLGVALGLLPAKDENDDQWLREYRAPEFVAQLASGLAPPPYVQAPVTSPDIEGAAAVPKDALDTLLQGLFNDLREASASVKQPTFHPADFEKVRGLFPSLLFWPRRGAAHIPPSSVPVPPLALPPSRRTTT